MNPEIGKYAGKGGHKLRGRPQSPDHVARRVESIATAIRRHPKKCAHCGQEFIRTTAAQRYCSGQCWNAVARKKREKANRVKITRDEYARLLDHQAGKCAICGLEANKHRLAVDHCHKTGVIRGLLCHRCNTAIGLLRDDPAILRRASAYLSADK